MKTLLKTLPLFFLAAAFVVNASAQTDKPAATPASAPDEKKALQIVFVPRELMEKNARSGKLKENTFYWTNGTDNPELAPIGQSEDGKPFLRVQGKYPAFDPNKTTEQRSARTKSLTTIYRAFNVPEGATTAKITYTARATHDVWGDPAGGRWLQMDAKVNMTRDGKAVDINMGGPKLNAGWQTKTINPPVPAMTQQVVVAIHSDAGIPLDIASLEVTFE